MKEILKDAMLGSSLAGIGALFVKFRGFDWITLSAALYLTVVAATIAGFRSRSKISGGLLDRLVLVIEGEELKMKKLISGEKYKIKGDLEKLQ